MERILRRERIENVKAAIIALLARGAEIPVLVRRAVFDNFEDELEYDAALEELIFARIVATRAALGMDRGVILTLA